MIPKYIKSNFDTLTKAAKAGRLALLEVEDKLGNKQYLLVLHNHLPVADTKGNTEEFVPVARMFKHTEEDNPYEMYDPPK